MNKKIMSGVCIMCMLANTTIYANTCKMKFTADENVGNKAVAIIFDADNKFIGGEVCDIEKNKDNYFAILKENYGNDKKVKLYFPNQRLFIGDLIKEEEKEMAENKDNNINPAYPTQIDSATAFMMVKEVNTVSENDDIKIELNTLFRGSEYKFTVDSDIEISSASDANAGLKNAPVSKLRAGDIVFCSTTLSGKLRSVELIFRPTKNDIIKDVIDYGTNFEKLYSVNNTVTERSVPISVFGVNNSQKQQYAFGLIKDVYSNGFELCNKIGQARQDINIDITNDTIVYVYDKEKKNGNIRIGDITDILKTGFNTNALDEQENVVDWEDSFEHNYALVRMNKGTAMEVAVYLNY